MTARSKLTEKLAVVSVIDPDAYTARTLTGDYVDMSKFNRVMFVFMAGEMASSGELDGAIHEATNDTGGGARLIAGKEITTLWEHTTDDDKQAIIEVDAGDLSAGYDFVAPVMVIGTDAVDAACVGLAGVPRYHPAAADDLASVDEIVN